MEPDRDGLPPIDANAPTTSAGSSAPGSEGVGTALFPSSLPTLEAEKARLERDNLRVLSVAAQVDRVIDILERAELHRADAERRIRVAIDAGHHPRELTADPTKYFGIPVHNILKMSFAQSAGKWVQVAYALKIDGSPLDNFIRTGDHSLVAGAVAVLRQIQGEALRRDTQATHGDEAKQSPPAPPQPKEPRLRGVGQTTENNIALVGAKRAAAKALRDFLAFVETFDADKDGNRVCPNDRPTLERKWADAVEACNAVYRMLLARLPKRQDMMIALEDMPSEEREVFDLLSQALGPSGITRYTPDGQPWLEAVTRSPEVPPVGLRVVEADRIRKLNAIVPLLDATKSPDGPPLMASSGASVSDGTPDDRHSPKRPKVTKADVDTEIQKRKGRMGPDKFTDLIRKVAKGDPNATALARNTFGRNKIARHLGCSGSVVSESPRWGEVADQLQLRPRKSSVRNKQGFDVAIEHKAATGPSAPDDAARLEMRSLLGRVSMDTAKLIQAQLDSGQMTPAQAIEVIRLESNPDADESPP